MAIKYNLFPNIQCHKIEMFAFYIFTIVENYIWIHWRLLPWM